MSQSGANVSQECISAFNDLKLAKKYKYIIFKLSDDNREIVIEEASGDKDWENFRENSRYRNEGESTASLFCRIFATNGSLVPITGVARHKVFRFDVDQ
ncbi:hypothetical protein F4801DRAFT_53465 [Xylaria longipes]|nr:hypothetical protein F4801DRAFT_53465 [Xylaria longipes]